MEHRTLGRSGLRVTTLTMGAMTFGSSSEGFMKGVSSTDEESRRVFDRALELGIDTVDTANGYSNGRSEELLGKFLEGKRQRVVLATKCRFPTGDARSTWVNDWGLSRKSILFNCEESLRRLRTDYIDLYQVHMQDGTVPVEETLSAMDDLIRAGKVRYIGCSNYTGYRLVESLWAADRRDLTRYSSVQLYYSLVARDAERELLPAARTFGLGILVWSPLSRGFLTGKYQKGQKPPEGSRLESWTDTMRGLNTDRNWAVLHRVRQVAQKHDTTPAAVALAWLLTRPEVTSIIVGARTVQQLEENVRAVEVKLTEAEVRELDEVSRAPLGYPYEFIGAREPW